MAHKVQSHSRVLVLGLEVAVPAEAEEGQIYDEVSARLSESGVDDPHSLILDWRYTHQDRVVQTAEEPEEGAVFYLVPESTAES